MEAEYCIANGHKHDAVVIYDRCSRLLGHPNPSTYNPAISGWPTYEEAARAWDQLDTVVKAIYEQEFTKKLERTPVLLTGGYAAWIQFIKGRAAKHAADYARMMASQANGAPPRSPGKMPNGYA